MSLVVKDFVEPVLSSLDMCCCVSFCLIFGHVFGTVPAEQAVASRSLAERAWDEFRTRQLAMQDAVNTLPRGTAGAVMLEEVASACSSCPVRRRASTDAAMEFAQQRFGASSGDSASASGPVAIL
jgi:hypothetical protein